MAYLAPMATPIISIRIPILLIKFSPMNFSKSDFPKFAFVKLSLKLGLLLIGGKIGAMGCSTIGFGGVAVTGEAGLA